MFRRSKRNAVALPILHDDDRGNISYSRILPTNNVGNSQLKQRVKSQMGNCYCLIDNASSSELVTYYQIIIEQRNLFLIQSAVL